MKKVVFTFGRMNPPTIGHQKLVDKVNAVARSNGADARVYLSHTQNAKKDPLSYKDKIRFARKAFGSSVIQSTSKTIMQVAQELEKSGYTDIILVVGSDRVPEFKKLLTKYNGKDYNFDSIEVVSAGERDPDAEGVEGMSASKLRKLAVDGDFDTFKSGLPKKLQGSDAKKIYDTIRGVIKEDLDIEEQRKPLTIQQRREIGRRMKRLAPKLARARRIKSKRKADTDTLKKRAMKKAREIIRKKVAGARGADYSNLSGTEKMTVDKLVAKRSAVVKKLAKRLLPKVRKSEGERLQKARQTTKEEFDALFEEMMLENDENKKKVPQDPDVKDKPGTQPKKYYKGLSDKEKEARAKQFARQTKKSDDDPSAYKEPPGNDDAKTKPSKHTKKYHQMFGNKEESAVDAAKEKIEREKESDKRKHDAMLDRARTRDTQSKNQQTEEYELSESASASLKKKSEKSGIPVGILRKVYNRGMAAWKTGHRPGASQQQWAFARVNSFITKGKGTWGGADSDLAAKARESKKESVKLDEDCWDGYKQVGMKKKGDKMVPDCVPEAQSPAQQAAIAISKKERGEKPKNEDDFKPHMMYDPKTGESEMAKVPADHERLSKKGYTHKKPKKNLKAMLGVPTARPSTQYGEETELEEMPRWLKEPLSKITHKKGYDAAKKVLKDVLDRKKKEAGKKGLQHSIEYYAGQIAKQFDGVDARALADMVNEEPEKMDAPEIGTDKIKKRYKDMTPGEMNESYVFAQDEIKIQGAFAHHPTTDFQEDYLGWDTGETLEESEYQGRKVKLNDPFRNTDGKSKFSVYVKNDKGNVVKVNFGDPNMEIKRDDPERRKSFRARHNCDNPGPKWKARYWSCYQWRASSKVDN